MKNKQEIMELLLSNNVEDVVLAIHIVLRYWTNEEMESIYGVKLNIATDIRLFVYKDKHILLNAHEILFMKYPYANEPIHYSGYKEIENIE